MNVDVSEDEDLRYFHTAVVIGLLFASLIVHDLFLLFDVLLVIAIFVKTNYYDKTHYKVTNMRDVRTEENTPVLFPAS